MTVFSRLKCLSRIEWACLLFAIVFSHLVFYCFRSMQFYYDETGYIGGARGISEHGVFFNYYLSYIRTYAYPLFLSTISNIGNIFHQDWLTTRLYIFYCQFIMYIGAAFFIRGVVNEKAPKYRVGTWFFCALCLNVFNLAYISFALTETLSLVCILMTLTFCIKLFPINNQAKLARWFFIFGLIVSTAPMVRPANFILWPTIVLFFIYQRVIMKQLFTTKTMVCFCVGLSIPVIPQFINNIVFHGTYTPLVAAKLGMGQYMGGLRLLKYATSIIPNVPPQVEYINPAWQAVVGENARSIFSSKAPLDAVKFLLYHPQIGFTAFAGHVFNLIDQDSIFPYLAVKEPWYRWITSIIGYLTAFFGGCGCFVSMRWLFCKKCRSSIYEEKLSRMLVSLLLFLFFYFGLYSTTQVETRFGLPVITILSFFIPVTWNYLLKDAHQRKAVLFSMMFFVALAIVLSCWVQKQAVW